MDVPPFIQSLHRPFNQALKTAKWVCVFLSTRQVKSSELNIEFYFYLVDFLNKSYKSNSKVFFSGIPSREAISQVSSVFEDLGETEKYYFLARSLRNQDRNSIESNIYSTYKAASYYVNMAKDKLELVDTENQLTKFGKDLISLRSDLFSYSEKEKVFFAQRIISADFLLIISYCFFKKIGKRYSIDKFNDLHYNFLEQYYNIKHFNFTTVSLENFNTVRNNWISSLNILDGALSIRKIHLSYINNNEIYSKWYTDLHANFENYSKNELKKIISIRKNSHSFESYYNKLSNASNSALGFVNLYDIKTLMKMSDANFQTFLSSYYEIEKRKRKIFFSNTVSSIDRRKRFSIRNTPVLLIKIK
jgi:hypothetical protein